METKDQIELNRENILQKLADFDFSVPVTVDVIFEDSDNNENSSSPDVIVTKECETDEFPIPSCSKSETDNSIENPIEARKKEINNDLSVNDNHNDKSAVCNDNYKNTTETGTQDVDCQKNLKRKLEDEPKAESFEDLKAKYKSIINNKNYEQNVQTPMKTLQSFVETHKTNTVKTDDKANRHWATYIINLLNTVAENLIVIIEAYIRYNEIKRISPDSARVNYEWNYFTRVKYHLFNLSYSTAVNIILPEMENSILIKHFLNEVLKIGLNRNLKLDLKRQIEPLFLELVNWTKRKSLTFNNVKPNCESQNCASKNNSAFVESNNNNDVFAKHTNSVSNYGNNRAPDINPYSQTTAANTFTNHMKENINSAKPVLFSSGPPGRQISIAVEPSLLQSRSGYNTFNSTAPSQPPRNMIHPCQSVQMVQHSTAYKQNCSEMLGSQKETGNMTILQKMLNENCVPTTRAPPPPYPNVQRQNIGFLRPATDASQMNAQMQILQPLQGEVSKGEGTRSASTDSGFMSPLHCSSPIETVNLNNTSTCKSKRYHFGDMDASQKSWPKESWKFGVCAALQAISMLDSKLNQEVGDASLMHTPVITHVTSLNPDASYIPESYCFVCGKATRKMCIGCYTKYYCSPVCQRADWNYHIIFCKIRK